MEVKKDYQIDDSVWIYGITKNNRLVEGKIIKKFTMDYQGYDDEPYYVVAIPTEIEPLLEIRTWHNISQDKHGPIGAFRNINTKDIVDRFIKKVGYNASDDDDDIEEPTAAEIHAALEKSKLSVVHQPLNMKENKPKKRYYHRAKKS
jgi:hypothetical protein